MKRIEAVIASEKVLAVNEALKRVGVGGCTVLEAKGRGKGEKPMVETDRGTRRFKAEFSVRADLVIVVQDSEVENIINTIVGTVSTGSAGDGKIFVSPINEAVDIGTQKRGEVAIK